MPVLVHRSSTRRRVLTAVGLVSVVAVIGVQAASGARTYAAGSAGNAGATGSSDTTGALPADQPALDAAADDAQSVAGSAYYTDAVVNDAADTVDVYLAGAPQSIIDQLQALHPGTYVIHNDAAHPLSELRKLQDSLPLATLSAEGIDVVSAGPTPDGHLNVGVSSSTDVKAAASALDSAAQSTLGLTNSVGIVELYGDAQPGTTTGYRYNEGTPYNGGDFITSIGTDRFNGQSGTYSNCSSGINVHATGNTNLTYILTAAHCSWIYGSNSNPGVGTVVHQGYYRNDCGCLYSGSSNTNMGSVKYISDDSAGNTTHDAALIPASTGYDVFKSGWNSSEIGAVSGVAENHSGDHVCISGAFTGEICGIEIQAIGTLKQLCPGGWPYCFYSNVNTAWNPNNTSFVGNADGDSGGPVYWADLSTGNKVARGMIEGTDGTTVSCSSISTPPGYQGSCYHVLWFQGQDSLDGAFNVTPNHN